MTDTPETDPTVATEKPAGSRRRWLLIAAAVVGVLAVAGIATAVVTADNDDTAEYAATQIGWMGQGRQEGADSYQGADGPDDAWCNSMAGWMDGRMNDDSMMGQGQMMGSMMWQNPANMRTTCEQWIADNPDGAPTGTDTSTWCGQMVDWMDQNMGGWDNWMMNGPTKGN